MALQMAWSTTLTQLGRLTAGQIDREAFVAFVDDIKSTLRDAPYDAEAVETMVAEMKKVITAREPPLQ